MIEFHAHRKQVVSLAFSPDGNVLATAGHEDGVRLWESPFTTPRTEIVVGGIYPQITFSPDGRWLACAGFRVSLWSMTTPAHVFKFIAMGHSVCVFSPDSATLVVATREAPLRRWHTDTRQELSAHWGQEIPNRYDQPRPTPTLAHGPHNRLVLGYFYYANEVKNYVCDLVLHDAETGAEHGKIRLAQSQPRVAFSPDGHTLAAIVNTQLRVYSVPDCRELAVRKTGRKHFQDLAFLPDGSRLVTVSNDQTVRLWDTTTWNEVSGYEWKIGKLACVAVSPDGMRMAAGGESGKVVVWDVD